MVVLQRADEGKDALSHDVVHLRRRFVLELRPAQGTLFVAEDRAFDGAFGAARFPQGGVVQIVQPFDEGQIGDLLDDFQRVRDAARPEGVPQLVYL